MSWFYKFNSIASIELNFIMRITIIVHLSLVVLMLLTVSAAIVSQFTQYHSYSSLNQSCMLKCNCHYFTWLQYNMMFCFLRSTAPLTSTMHAFVYACILILLHSTLCSLNSSSVLSYIITLLLIFYNVFMCKLLCVIHINLLPGL